MTEQKTSYVIYPYLKEFKDTFIIKDDTRFFLNSVKVYGIQSQDKIQFIKIDFDIKKELMNCQFIHWNILILIYL